MRGYILFETCVAYIIAVYTVVTLITVFSLAAKANPVSEKTFVASALASELMEEVRLRKWDETQPAYRPAYPAYSPSTLGTDSGESASSKATFDDIDDFNGWTESSPQDPAGGLLAGCTDFQRTVTVSYVTASLAASGSPTDYKKVTACAVRSGLATVCLDWIAGRL